MTKLFNSMIVGPIHSRRLGSSLGINLLPQYGKLCNFDCIYCECGWNKDGRKDTKLPTAEEIETALESRLKEIVEDGTVVDSITYSGNGEPTLHPQFAQIVDITIRLRDLYIPSAKISLLSNATQIGRKEVRDALMKIDNPILKIDSPIENMLKEMNRPANSYSLQEVVENLKLLEGRFILQTMFLKGYIGEYDCLVHLDSTDKDNVEKWRELVRTLSPRQIMIYTIDRDTPQKGLSKVSYEELLNIAQPLIDEGFDIVISA